MFRSPTSFSLFHRLRKSTPTEGKFLIEFTDTLNPFTSLMRPTVRKIETLLGTKVQSIDVNYVKDAEEIIETITYGKTRCSRYPVYYNRKSGKVICGSTNFDNFRNWATERLHKSYDPLEQQRLYDAKIYATFYSKRGNGENNGLSFERVKGCDMSKAYYGSWVTWARAHATRRLCDKFTSVYSSVSGRLL
jgi:hypothetical protein